MAHRDWCGKSCGDCIVPCALDMSIPCSPNCENLFPNGTINIVECFHAGCDVSNYRRCLTCSEEYYGNSEADTPNFIWECENDDCLAHFCEKCFIDDIGKRNLRSMIEDDDAEMLCPVCYRKSKRISKYFAANGIYQDKAGQQYRIFYKPNIRGYYILQLQSNGDIVSNSGFVAHRWPKELKCIRRLEEHESTASEDASDLDCAQS